TLFPLPAGAPPAEDDLRVYFSFNVAQGVFRPFTPMGTQAIRLAASGMASLVGAAPRDPAAGPSALVEAAQRLFLDVTPLLRRGLPEAVPRIFPAAAAGLAASAAASRLLGTLAAPEELEAVRRGLPHNPTTEMDLALWGLAERARADPAAAEALAGSAPVE